MPGTTGTSEAEVFRFWNVCAKHNEMMELTSKDEIYISYAPSPDSRQRTTGKTFSVPLFFFNLYAGLGVEFFIVMSHQYSKSFRS